MRRTFEATYMQYWSDGRYIEATYMQYWSDGRLKRRTCSDWSNWSDAITYTANDIVANKAIEVKIHISSRKYFWTNLAEKCNMLNQKLIEATLYWSMGQYMQWLKQRTCIIEAIEATSILKPRYIEAMGRTCSDWSNIHAVHTCSDWSDVMQYWSDVISIKTESSAQWHEWINDIITNIVDLFSSWITYFWDWQGIFRSCVKNLNGKWTRLPAALGS